MVDDPVFFFPLDTSDEWNGFNDPGIEHFSGNPYLHVGKEIAQNSVDANDPDRDEPVRIAYELTEIDTNSVPGVVELRDAVNRCLAVAQSEGPKALQFFEDAQAALDRESMKVLLVSDYATLGIRGPSRRQTPYHTFMKATGRSQKSEEDRLGSYGIGKFAPYTLSGLRTVFVSTVWRDDHGVSQHFVQGKSILMSHVDEAGRTRKGTGYWGKVEQCQPVENPGDEIPDWLSRSGLGTTLAILDFRPVELWSDVLMASVAQSFFGAIHDQKLVVDVEGTELDSDGLHDTFTNPSILAAVENVMGTSDDFNEARWFHEALAVDDDEDVVVVRHRQDTVLGHCSLRVLVNEGLPKRVAVLRDGMFISADLPGLKRFSDFKDFVAVFQCETNDGNELLRAMEPPSHNAFEPNRLHGQDAQRRGRRALRDISRWIRGVLKDVARDPVSDETSLEELAEYFADEESEPVGAQSGEPNPVGDVTIQVKPTPVRRTRIQRGDATDGDSGDEPGAGPGGTEGGSGNGQGGGGHGNTERTRREIGLSNVRVVPQSPKQRLISFRAVESAQLALSLQASGADADEPLAVVETSRGRLAGGRIVGLQATEKEEVSLLVTFGRDFGGSVRVTAHEV